MNKHLIPLIAALITAAPLTAEQLVSESANKATLTVHVVSGTQGGSVAEGSPITVSFYQQGRPIQELTGATDNEGNCTLDGVPTGPELIAVAQAKHKDMLFSGSPVPLPSEETNFETTVQVFEVAYDNTLIGAGTHHLIIKRHDDGIRVTEYLQLTNDQDKAILSSQKDAGGKPKVVQVSLPKGFENLTFSNYFHPDAVVVTEEGFYDTMAIPPGQYHGVFSYDLKPQKGIIDFTKEITLPEDSVMVFVQAAGVTATGLDQPAGQMTLTDGAAADYYTADVSQGSVLRFQLEVMQPESSGQQTWLIMAIVFAAVVLVAGVRLMRR